MATDVLTLGPFVFDAWSTPEKLPFGGRQAMHVHKMPGGLRTIDCMGPDDIDRAWSAQFWGQDAVPNALLLDALRRAGEPLPFSNGVESRSVVILEFLPMVHKATHVEFSIILTPCDSDGGGGQGFGGFGAPSLDLILAADLNAAVGLLQ